MSISIDTLAILLSIANLLYVLVLYRQYRLTPNFPGLKLWVTSGALLAGGFFLNFLRMVPSLEILAIMSSNIFWLAGMIGLYAGLSEFLQRTVQWRPFLLISLVFVLLYGYLVLFQPHDLSARRLLFSLLATWLFGLMAWVLWRHHAAAVRGSALFLAGVFAVESGFFLLRFGITLLSGADNGQAGLTAEPIQVLTYLMTFICSSLWTFGLILLVNQRLNTDYFAAKQQVEIADRAKETFIANISHELNTPLHAILGHLHLYNEQINPNAKQQTHLQGIHAGAAHLHTLVNAILDAARLEHGQYAHNPAPLDLPGLLNHVQRIIELKADAKKLQLRLNLPLEIPLKITVDGLYLRQILLNLLNNAINYTAQGWVELALTINPLSDGQAHLVFRISDSGAGIAHNDLARLLRPFERGNTHQPGVGLGLSIVNHLLAKMDSELRIISTLGQGSQFSFALTVPVLQHSADSPQSSTMAAVPEHSTLRQLWQDTLLGRFPALVEQLSQLPPTQSGFAQRAQAFATAADQTGMVEFLRQHWAVEAVAPTLESTVIENDLLRLLIIDDDAFNIHLLAHYLREFNCDILSATHGEAGLRLAQLFSPQLILLDMKMPGIDGLETCRRLQANAKTRAIPVVFFSATTDEHAAAFAAGAMDYLRKPMREDELITRITRYLNLPQLHDGHLKRLQNYDSNNDYKHKQYHEYVIKRMYEIRDRLQNDLQHTPTMDELAQDAGLNRNKISEQFKLLFGNTPHAWQREQRLLLASRLLRESEMDIRDIARDSGHSSQAAFSRAFKQRFGLSPREFRASVQI